MILLVLLFSVEIMKLVPEGVVHLLTRIFGVLLSAIAVQFIAESVTGLIRMKRG